MNSRSQTQIQENVHPKNSFNVERTLTLLHNTNLVKKIGKLQFRGAGSSNGFIQLITYKSSLRMLVFARIENTLQHHKKVKLQIS